MACWCYGTVSSILLLKTDLAVMPLSLASPGILALYNFWLIDRSIDWLMLDSYLVFLSLLISIIMSIFLFTFTVLVSILWFVLQDTIFSLDRFLIWFQTTFLLLLTCKFYQTIVGLSHKLSCTESYNWSTLKLSRLISKILNWLDILKLMQKDWLSNMYAVHSHQSSCPAGYQRDLPHAS